MKICLADIVSYIGVGVRPIKEGQRVFLAGHVRSCGKSGPHDILVTRFFSILFTTEHIN